MFAAALDDYALGCPGANIILVNYGDIANAMLDQVDVSRKDRCYAIAKMRPDNHDALDHFKELIQATIPAHTSITAQVTTNIYRFGNIDKIIAEWTNVHSDIDLHLFVRDKKSNESACINYRSKGHESCFPQAQLEKDIQSSPGGEIIELSLSESAEYDLFINIYVGKRNSAPGSISVRIEGELRNEKFMWPANSPGSWWHVCWFDEDGIVRVVDRVYDMLPSYDT